MRPGRHKGPKGCRRLLRGAVVKVGNGRVGMGVVGNRVELVHGPDGPNIRFRPTAWLVGGRSRSSGVKGQGCQGQRPPPLGGLTTIP